MRAIVIGTDGGVGRTLAQALRERGDAVHGTTRRIDKVTADTSLFDLAADTGAPDLPEADVAFICAAILNLAECRADPERARRVNLEAPAQLAARWAKRTIFVSTSAVFDCQEPLMRADRPRKPTSVYGGLKAKAEDAVLACGGTIVRATKIFVPGHPLLRRWHEALSRGDSIEAAEDHRVAPILLDYLAAALMAIADKGEGGIYQVSAACDVSYAEIATWTAHHLHVDESRVAARAAVDIGIPAAEVLPYTSLDSSRLAALMDRPPPQPWVAVENVLASLR